MSHSETGDNNGNGEVPYPGKLYQNLRRIGPERSKIQKNFRDVALRDRNHCAHQIGRTQLGMVPSFHDPRMYLNPVITKVPKWSFPKWNFRTVAQPLFLSRHSFRNNQKTHHSSALFASCREKSPCALLPSTE